MENISLDMLRELGWGVEVFAVVTLTLLVRYILLRMLKVMEQHLDKTENVWDDAVFDAARAPLSWFILIMGLIWAVEIVDANLNTDLFSSANMDLVRQITFIVLITLFAVRFVSQAEVRVLHKIEAATDAEPSGMDPTTLRALAKLLRLSVGSIECLLQFISRLDDVI